MAGKSKQTTGPSKTALPYLNKATGALDTAYGQSSAAAARGVETLNENLPTVLGRTINNSNLGAARGYNADVLGGKYLSGNPFLDDMIDDTNASVTDRVNSGVGSRGITGGSAHSQILARELARNETGLRYGDYTTERGRQDAAVGQATNLASADNQGIATLLAYLTGTAELPMAAASPYAAGIGGLWGNSTTTTQKKSPGLIDFLAAASSAASKAGGGG